MKKGNEITPNKRTYGWALIFIFIVIAGTLAYYSDSLLPEKFNPDLHFNSELHDCTGWEVNYFLRWGETDSKGNAYALPPDCNELHNDVGGLVGWDCPSHNCVSWQPKTKAQLSKEYCKNNATDAEKCRCVRWERRGSNESTYDCWTINHNYAEDDDRRYDERSYSRTHIYNGITIITNNVDGRKGVKEVCEFRNTFVPIREICVEAVPR